MANTDVSICSVGLMQVGGKPINSFDTPGDAAVFLKAAYPTIRDNLISCYPWEAFKVRTALTRENGSPGGTRYAFLIPGDALSPPIAVYDAEDSLRGTSRYEVRGGKIVTNYPEIWAEFTTRRPEAQWPAWFVRLMQCAVSAAVAYLVTDQQSVQDQWIATTYGTPSEAGLGGLVGTSMIIDAQGSGNNPGISDSAFVDARFGGVYPGEQI